MLKVIYGIVAAYEDDPYIVHVDDALEAVSQGLISGKFLLEYIPSLRHLPPWFPGTGSNELFAKWRAASMALKHAPYNHVKDTEVSILRRSSVGLRLTLGAIVVRTSIHSWRSLDIARAF